MKIRLAAIAALALIASRVHAEPIPAEIALARRLFSEARAAESSKDWPTASAKLRDAITIKETAGLRFHLAYCEEQQGMLVEALNDYERAEDLLTQPNDDFRSQLPSKKESLHKRIPTVTLVMPPDVTDASLTVDDHPLSSAFLGKAIPLNPGRHTVVVSSPNRATFTTELMLNETDAVVTNPPMPPLAKPLGPGTLSPSAQSAAPTADAPSSTSSSRTRTYVLIGEAALVVPGLVFGIGYTVAASSQDSQAASKQAMLGRDGCAFSSGPRPPACAELQSALDAAHNDRVLAAAGFIDAGVWAAAFVGTLLLWPAPRAKVAIAPIAAPTLAGLSVGGQF